MDIIWLQSFDAFIESPGILVNAQEMLLTSKF